MSNERGRARAPAGVGLRRAGRDRSPAAALPRKCPVPPADEGAPRRPGPAQAGPARSSGAPGSAGERHPAGNVGGGGQRRADFFGRVRAGRCLVGRERGSGPTPAPTVCLRRGFERLAPSWVGTGPSEAGGPPGARSRRGFPRGRRGREGHPSALPPGSRVAALRAPPPTPPWPAGARGPRLAAPGPGGSRSGKVH